MASVYGLRLEGDVPVTGVRDDDAPRAVALRAVDAIDWPDAGARLASTAGADGAPFMTVDHDAARGYRIAAPGHGVQRLDEAGGFVELTTAGVDWQRLLFAQTLPTAAALQGMEPLHAGAVVIDGAAVAVCAPSGTGKSTTVAELVALGTALLTDDVLVVDGVTAHPGPGAEAAAAPLGHVVFLERGGPGTAATLTEVRGDDPRRLLTATFVPHLGGGRRLVSQLEACARIARSAACAVLDVPEGVSARDAAAALRDWVSASA